MVQHIWCNEIRVNVKFTHPNSRINSRVLAPLVLGAVWAWWMLLGRDLHWMMRNEAGEEFYPLKSLRRIQ